MKYIDLTHTFHASMPVYPGDPVPELTQIANIHHDGFTDHRITVSMHVGTHLDAPLHMLEGGSPISELNIEAFFGRGQVLDARGRTQIGKELLKQIEVQPSSIVLIMTGFSSFYSHSAYYRDYPIMTEEFAQELVHRRVRMVGMDTPSPDRAPFNVHKILLKQNILILENLTHLEQLIDVSSFEVIALPVKFHTDAAPTRVIARY